MAEFICRNEECENKDKTIYNGYATYRMLEDKLVADERFCTVCNREMEEIKIKKEMGFNISEMNNPDKNFSRRSNGKTIY